MSQWKWCVEGEDGKVLKGWYQDNDNWYYLNDEGIMQTGWIKDKDGRWYYLDSNGAMKTGWLKDKDKWYYLEPNSTGYKGSMYCNETYTIDGKSYKFNSSGAWIEDSLVSDNLIEFIKSYEGFSSSAYVCPSGVKTIGYGTTRTEYVNKGTCTKEEATAWLKEDINTFAKAIKDKEISFKQCEFDALVSFAYNCGTGALFGSTLWKNVIAGVRDSNTITGNFQAWCNGSNGRLEGSYRRRTKEANMFLYADYTGNV